MTQEGIPIETRVASRVPVAREPYVGGAWMRDNMSAMPVMATRLKLGRRADRRVDVAAQRRANSEPVEHDLY
ncbi:hypothetical protein SAMN04487769_0921 [Burkholderia sp. b14]|nr:hypothetical protein SAMN04487769_0921 [Burkholderia sp. b14]